MIPLKTRSLLACAFAAAAVLLATGCAVSHSEKYDWVIVTGDSAPPAQPVRSLAVVTFAGRFSNVTTKGKTVEGLANIGNARVHTLFAALAVSITAVFTQNGIQAEAVTGNPANLAEAVSAAANNDYVLIITPHSMYESGSAPAADLTLHGELWSRQHVKIWSGSIGSRMNMLSRETQASITWGGDMADDVANVLLKRWNKEGIVKLAEVR